MYPTLTGVTSPQPDNFHFAGTPCGPDDHSSSGKLLTSSSDRPPARIVRRRVGRRRSRSNVSVRSPGPSSTTPIRTIASSEHTRGGLASAQLTSNYIALQVAETHLHRQIILPGFANEYQNAYFVAYDSGGSIPFIVIGGQYFTVGTLVEPGRPRGDEHRHGRVGDCNPERPGVERHLPGWPTGSRRYMLKVDGGQPVPPGRERVERLRPDQRNRGPCGRRLSTRSFRWRSSPGLALRVRRGRDPSTRPLPRGLLGQRVLLLHKVDASAYTTTLGFRTTLGDRRVRRPLRPGRTGLPVSAGDAGWTR